MSIDIMVSPAGKNTGKCGRLIPCRTVSFAAGLAESGDVIGIKGWYGSGSRRDPHVDSADQFPIIITKNLTFIGVNGIPLLTKHCLHGMFAFYMPVPKDRTQVVMLKLINLEFRIPVLKMEAGYAVIQKCKIHHLVSKFERTAVFAYMPERSQSFPNYVNLKILHTVVTGFPEAFYCPNVTDIDLYIANSYLSGSKSNAVSAITLGQGLKGSSFSGSLHAVIVKRNFSKLTSAVSFNNYGHWSPAILNVSGCYFRDNGHGITTISKYMKSSILNIENSYFIDNKSPVGGGAVELLWITCSLINSVFRNNTAGTAGGALLAESSDIKIASNLHFDGNIVSQKNDNDLFELFFPSHFPHQKFKGFGGAVALLPNVSAKFVNCTFVDNRALFGGSVAHLGDKAEFHKCNFSGPAQGHSVLGDMIYSQRSLVLSGVKLFALTGESRASVIFHREPLTYKVIGHLWYDSLYMECPKGSAVVDRSSSKRYCQPYRLTFGTNKCISVFMRFCSPCPSREYSLKKSSAFGSISQEEDHFTQAECRSCPYGGHCAMGQVNARAGFWGYVSKGQVEFVRCPSGYCCERVHCKGIQSCAPFRTGPLCGRCIAGYTESLATEDCVPIKGCASKSLWFLVIFGAFVYFCFLFWMDDFKGLCSFIGYIFNCCKKKVKGVSTKCCKTAKPSSNNTECQNVASGNAQIGETGDHSQSQRFEPPADGASEGDEEAVMLITGGVNSNDVSISQDMQQFGDCTQQQVHNVNGASEKVGCRDPSAEGEIKQSSVAGKQDEFSEKDDKRFFGGLIKITAFFYQVQAILDFNDIDADARKTSWWLGAKRWLTSLINFDMFLSFSTTFCSFPDAPNIAKRFFFALCVLITLAITVVMCFLCRVYIVCKKEIDQKVIRSCKGKFVATFIQVLLLGYSSLTVAVFYSLRCESIGEESVMFFDGSTKCSDGTKTLLILISVVFIGPFMGGPPLLARYFASGQISLFIFFLGFLFPIFPCLYFIACKVQTWINKIKNTPIRPAADKKLSEEDECLSEAICKAIEGPFRYSKSRYDYRYWEFVLIGARLVLISISAFVKPVVVRNTVMVVFSAFIFGIQCFARPFKSFHLNALNGIVLFNLCLIGALNLFPVYFFASGHRPVGTMNSMYNDFATAERYIFWGTLILAIISLVCQIPWKKCKDTCLRRCCCRCCCCCCCCISSVPKQARSVKRSDYDQIC